MTNKRLVQASFFWKNDKPEGLGFTLGEPEFSPAELEAMFAEHMVKQYFIDSDMAMGTFVVQGYLTQLEAIATAARQGKATMQQAILAALNILWLSERGFIPKDEFNGAQFLWGNLQ
jgi:hypothetical protein